MKAAAWIMVAAFALFPWWGIAATMWLVPLPWDQAARVVTATVAAMWTPVVLLAALLVSAHSKPANTADERAA